MPDSLDTSSVDEEAVRGGVVADTDAPPADDLVSTLDDDPTLVGVAGWSSEGVEGEEVLAPCLLCCLVFLLDDMAADERVTGRVLTLSGPPPAAPPGPGLVGEEATVGPVIFLSEGRGFFLFLLSLTDFFKSG